MLPRNYLVAVERGLRRISFIDSDTLAVNTQLAIDGDIIDVAVTGDNRKAVVSAFLTEQLFEVDLQTYPPSVTNSVQTPNAMEDVAITVNDRFAVSVDGTSLAQQFIVSYALGSSSIHSAPADAQAVSVHPTLTDRIFVARYNAGRVRLYLIDNTGALTDTGMETTAGQTPLNLAFTPDGQFCFVADFFANEMVVLATGNPAYFGETSRVSVDGNPQTIVVSGNGRQVYVLTSEVVAVFDFDPVAQRLLPARAFPHQQTIVSYFGVERMTLDAGETKLFISGDGQVAAFDLAGTFLGIVQGVQADGGIASAQSVRLIPEGTLLVNNNSGQLLFLDPELNPIIGEVNTLFFADNVVISQDCTRAAVPSQNSRLYDIDLTANPPSLAHTADTPVPLRGMDITPDTRFAVGVSYNADGRLVSYSFADQTVQSIPSDAESVAVSPNGNGFILAARYLHGRVRRYRIDGEGNLTDTGMEAAVNDSPANLAYSPDGNFAFVANWGSQEIVVLDTSHPLYFGEASRIQVNGGPQTIIVSEDGLRVYVLTSVEVLFFTFNPVSKQLTLQDSFRHQLTFWFVPGVKQMAVNEEESQIYIMAYVTSGFGGLFQFTFSGQQTGVFAPIRPGIAICDRH